MMFAFWRFYLGGIALLSSWSFSFVVATTTRTGRWEHGRVQNCDYLFSASRREKYRHDQKDALLIWLGSPSEAIRVDGKHGTVPLPSAWGAFASVLYTQCPYEHTETGYRDFEQFLSSWMNEHPSMKDRPLYLAGNTDIGSTGSGVVGEFVVHLAHSLLNSSSSVALHLSGIFVHANDPILLPSALFFAAKSFESGNAMNFWTMDRARQPVVCNAKVSAVEFFSYDIKLCYELKEKEDIERSGEKGEMFEYHLTSVTDWTGCYEDIDSFATFYSEKDKELAKKLEKEATGDKVYEKSKAIDPALPNANAINDAFPLCKHSNRSRHSIKQVSLLHAVNDLLTHNVSVFLYSDIPHASEIICSFYIGIFVADALQFSPPNDSDSPFIALEKAQSRFNAATMEVLPTSWGSDIESEKSPGVIQQSDNLPMISTMNDKDSTNRGSLEPVLMSMFLRSSDRLNRVDPSLRSNASKRHKNRIVVSKIGAIAIFARLLHALANSEIDLLELMVMDRIDERAAAVASDEAGSEL